MISNWNQARRTLLVAALATFATSFRSSEAFANLVDLARRYDAQSDTSSGVIEDQMTGERYYWYANHQTGESDLWLMGVEAAHDDVSASPRLPR